MSGETSPEINISPPEEKGFPLTKEFLELAFDREVEKFSINAGTNPGDNYMSIMHAIEVTFKGEKEANHYLLKCYPSNPGRRAFLDKSEMFSKEYFMYQDFLPQLKQLAAESGVEDVVDLAVAPVHGGNIVGKQSKFTNKEPWSNENFILMTDLRKTLGLTMEDRVAGLDLEHAKIALEEISKLHALSWAYKQKHGITLLSDKYPQFAEDIEDGDNSESQFKQLMDHISKSSVKMVEEKLGSSHPACKSFKDFVSVDLSQKMKTFMKKNGINENEIESHLRIKPEHDENYNNEPWLLGTHGDCWVNNMLFLYNNGIPKKPVSVTLVDYQINREACPTIDLAYFLFMSVRSSLRIPNLDKLLRIYHDAFIRYCEALQVKPLPGFSFETLKRRYRRAQHYGLVVSLPVLSILLKPPKESVDMDGVKSEQMEDLFASVMSGNDKNDLLKHEISATVLDMYETGVI